MLVADLAGDRTQLAHNPHLPLSSKELAKVVLLALVRSALEDGLAAHTRQ